MHQDTKKSYTTSLILIGCLFFIFGFITWLNGTLIPFLKTTCQLNIRQASLVTFAFFISYFVMAIPSSAILKKTGFKNGMSLGLVVMAIGCITFIPAAMQRSYPLFLTGLFIQGLGLSILQTASNPYVTIIGPIESAAKRISLMGICNKAAGFLSPIVVGTILLSNMDSLNKQLDATAAGADKDVILTELANRIITPYIVLTIVLLLVAVLIRYSSLPDIRDDENKPDAAIAPTDNRPLSSYTYLFMGAFAIFTYVGVEVLAGDYIINYGSSLGLPIEYAKYLTSLTLAFMVLGYLAGAVITPKYVSQEKLFIIFLLVSILVVVGVLIGKGSIEVPMLTFNSLFDVKSFSIQLPISVFLLAFLGFTHAIMWPAIWPMSIKGLGRHTKIGSALLIMGIAGGAIVPYIYGNLGVLYKGNLQLAFWIMIPCYLYMLIFATVGHRWGYKEPAKDSMA